MPDTETPQGQETQPSFEDMQNRINELYGAKQEADTISAELKTQNATLQQELIGLKQQVAALTTMSKGELPQTLGEDRPTPSGESKAVDIEAVVQKALDGFRAEQAKQAKATQLVQAHQQAMSRAAQNYPDLQDPQSTLNKVAQEIWDRRQDLRTLPDGPFIAVTLAANLMGNTTVSEERKLAAGGVSGPSAGPGAGANSVTKQLETLKAEKVEVDKRLRSGYNGADYQKSNELRVKIAEMEAQLTK